MKKRYIAIGAIALLAIAGDVTHVATLDGLDGVFWSSMFHEDTVYAPGYSDTAFRKIHAGMPESEVKALLGAPISLYPAYQNTGQDWTTWCYSDSPGDTHYRIRAIRMKDGVVIGKHAEFYVD
jgi:hypothetical protein